MSGKSFKEAVTGGPEAHIMEARQIAETIYSKPPWKQVEMIIEIKKSLQKRFDTTSLEINEL